MDSAGAGERSSVRVTGNKRQVVGAELSHPYYWAPFILIGNGLQASAQQDKRWVNLMAGEGLTDSLREIA